MNSEKLGMKLLNLKKEQVHQLKDSFINYTQKLDSPLVTDGKWNEVKIDIKRFCKILGSIIQTSAEQTEQMLRQLSMARKISFADFKKLQKEYLEQLYTNPSHPLDLSIPQLNEIRQQFEEAAVRARDRNSNDEGIPIDGFSAILARKMNVDQSGINKFLQDSTFFNYITWNEFQSMLDKESTVREELLDWFMYKESPQCLDSREDKSLQEKCSYSLKPKDRTSQRVYEIEFLLDIKVDIKSYFLCVFDESTIAAYHADSYESALEFVIPQDTYSSPEKRSPTKIAKPFMNEDESPRTNSFLTVSNVKNLHGIETINENSQKINQNNGNATIIQQATNYQQGSMKKSVFSSMYSNQSKTPIKSTILTEVLHTQTDHSRRINTSSDEFKQNSNKSAYFYNSPPPRKNKTSMQNRDACKTVMDTTSPKNESAKRNGRDSSLFVARVRSQSTNIKTPIFNNSKCSPAKASTVASTAQKKSFLNQNSSYFNSNKKETKISSENNATQMNVNVNFKKAVDYFESPKELLKPIRAFSTNPTAISPISALRLPQPIMVTSESVQPKQSYYSMSNNISKKDNKRESSLLRLLEGVSNSNVKIKEDPDLFKVIKAYLTADIRDDVDRKKILVNFEQFYSLFNKDPIRYQGKGNSSNTHKSIYSSSSAQQASSYSSSGRTMTQEDEDYILKDEETRETIKKLWKRFHYLEPEFSTAYAKAINEIIREKNLKNINSDHLKLFFQNQIPPANFQQKQKNQRAASSQPQDKAQAITGKMINQRTEMCKSYLKDMKDIDDHININPWTNEWRQKKEFVTSPKIKEIEIMVQKKLQEKEQKGRKTKEENDEQKNKQNGNSENNKRQTMQVRTNRLKTLAIEYSNELNILALGMINRQLQLFSATHIKSRLEMKKIFAKQFGDCIIGIAFRKNIVTQKWNIALLFENDVLEIFDMVFNSREQRIVVFEHFFSHTFKVEVDQLKMFPEFGFVLTSYKGEFFVFQDHLTSQNSSESVKNVPEYYLDQENKIQEGEMALSITSIACCESFKLLIFGTSRGKIAFYEIKTREFKGIKEAGGEAIINLHIYKEQNQALAICRKGSVTVWDIARRILIQTIRGIEEGPEGGNISTSLFSNSLEQLLIAASSIKVWEMRVSSELLFKERKMLQLYEWRKKNIKKQENKLLIQRNRLRFGQDIEVKQADSEMSQDESNTPKKSTENNKLQIKPKSTRDMSLPGNSKDLQPNQQQTWSSSLRQVLCTGESIVTWDTSGEIRILSRKNLKVKYSFMLSVTEEPSKIECIDILDSKILALCSDSGNVYLQNLYSDDMYQKISEYTEYPLKITIIQFLPLNMQMSLVAASQDGKILFLSSYLQQKTNRKYILLHPHKKRIISLVSNSQNTLVSSAEDNFIVIYSLRSCAITYKIDLQTLAAKQSVQQMSFVADWDQNPKERSTLLVTLEEGQMVEINSDDGSIGNQFSQNFGAFSCFEVDDTGKYILAVDENLILNVYARNEEANLSEGWSPNSPNTLRKGVSYRQQQTDTPKVLFHRTPKMIQQQSAPRASNYQSSEKNQWRRLSNLTIDLKKEQIFGKDLEQQLNIDCIKIIYGINEGIFCVFLSSTAAVFIDHKNFTKRYFVYESGKLMDVEQIKKASSNPYLISKKS